MPLNSACFPKHFSITTLPPSQSLNHQIVTTMLLSLLKTAFQGKFPFLFHVIIASPAGLTFIFRPSRQLSPLTPAARLILQCYGGCLLFTNLMALIFLTRPFDDTTRLATVSFAFWHLWPSYRAVLRLQCGIDTAGQLGETLGGPVVHLTVHLVLVVMFFGSACLT